VEGEPEEVKPTLEDKELLGEGQLEGVCEAQLVTLLL
jgi:hypothetical protein